MGPMHTFHDMSAVEEGIRSDCAWLLEEGGVDLIVGGVDRKMPWSYYYST